MPHANEMTSEIRDCINECLDCYAICKETATHCLMALGEQCPLGHQKLLADCGEACLTSADFMLRLSPYYPQYCNLCAELCKACGDSSERLARGDETMRKCADSCRRCEQSCRKMVHTMAA